MKKLRTALVTLGLVAPGLGLAVELDSGTYIGIEGAYNLYRYHDNSFVTTSTSQFNNNTIGSGITVNPDDKAGASGNFHIGYLTPLQPDFALGGELGYTYYGKIHTVNYTGITGTASSSIKQSGIELLGVAKFRFTEDINAFIKGGISYALINQEASGIVESGAGPINFGDLARGNHNSTNAIVKAGLGYRVTQGVDIYAYYAHLFGENYYDTEAEQYHSVAINSMGVGLNWFFG